LSKGSTSATITIPIQKTGAISLKERSSSAIALQGDMQAINKEKMQNMNATNSYIDNGFNQINQNNFR